MKSPRGCHIARCLGHADQRTVEVACARCGGVRWVPDPWIPLTKDGRAAGPPVPLVLPYTCARCRAVLAGKNVVDPLDSPTPAQQAAREAASSRLIARAKVLLYERYGNLLSVSPDAVNGAAPGEPGHEPLRQEHRRLLALFPERFRHDWQLTPSEIAWESENLDILNDALRRDLAGIGINSRKPQGRRTSVAKVDSLRRGPGGDLASGGFAMLSKSVIGTRDLVGVLDVIPGAAFKAYAVSCSVARDDGTFYLGHARLARLLGLKSEASGQRIAALLCRAGLWRKLASGHTGRETDYQLCAIEDVDRTRAVLAAGLRWAAD